MPSVTVIVNRNARGLKDGSRFTRFVESLAGVPCAIVETRTLPELTAYAMRAVRERPDVVVLAGGDGSVMEGLSAIARAYAAAGLDAERPRFGIVPAGTFSTIASNLGLSHRPIPYARRLVEAAAGGRARVASHATLRVRDAAGSDRLGFIFGTGLVSEFFEIYDEADAPGPRVAVSLVARLFVGSFTQSPLARRVLTPLPMRLTIDGQPVDHDRFSLVVSSVLRDVGLHLRPTRRAGEDPSRVHVVASTRHATHLALQLPFVLAARRMRGRGHVDALAKTFRVSFDGTSRSYVLDGDRIVAGHAGDEAWVDVERGPDVQILSP